MQLPQSQQCDCGHKCVSRRLWQLETIARYSFELLDNKLPELEISYPIPMILHFDARTTSLLLWQRFCFLLKIKANYSDSMLSTMLCHEKFRRFLELVQASNSVTVKVESTERLRRLETTRGTVDMKTFRLSTGSELSGDVADYWNVTCWGMDEQV